MIQDEKVIQGKRESWADLTKAIAIWLVVLGHANLASKYLEVVILSFHMPLFFFLSGYFDKGNLSVWKTVLKSCLTLIIPYFFMSFLALSWCWVSPTLHPELYPGHDSLSKIFSAAFIGIFLMEDQVTSYSFMPNEPLWFLVALFFVKIYFSIVINCVRKVKEGSNNRYFPMILWGGGGLLLIISLAFGLWLFHFPWFSLDSAVLAIPFYILGYVVKKAKLISYLNGRIVVIIFILTLAYILTISPINGRVDMNAGIYGEHYFFFSLNAIIGCLMCISIGKILDYLPNKIILKIGKDTLIIVGFHILFLMIAKVFCSFIFHSDFSHFPLYGSILISIISVLLCLPISVLLNKYVPFLVGKSK